MRIATLLFSLSLLCTACTPSGSSSTSSADGVGSSDAVDHAPYTKLLKAYVDDKGLVNYAELQKNRAPLDAFIASFAQLDPTAFDDWSDESKIAFWINAYNAITLKYIIDHYPIKKGGIIKGLRFPDNSIRQIDGVWTKLTTRIMDRDLTLDAIEHEILRKEFREPRIHAALVCAAKSCPPLRQEAFTAARLEEQLSDQSTRFMSSDKGIKIDPDNEKLYLTSILDWFKDDFVDQYNASETISGHGKKVNATLDYTRMYTYAKAADYIQNADYDVDYLDYDWSLNEQ